MSESTRSYRMVAAIKLGRPLTSEEIVHHIDNDRNNNSPDNLTILTQSEHTRQHMQGRTLSVTTRRKISEAKKGSRLSPEHKRSIARSNKQRWKNMTQEQQTAQIEQMVKVNLGRRCSPETKRKISEARKGHRHSEVTKRRIRAALRMRGRR